MVVLPPPAPAHASCAAPDAVLAEQAAAIGKLRSDLVARTWPPGLTWASPPATSRPTSRSPPTVTQHDLHEMACRCDRIHRPAAPAGTAPAGTVRCVPRPIRRGVPHGCASRLFAASMAFTLISGARHSLFPPEGETSNDAADFASWYIPPDYRAFDLTWATILGSRLTRGADLRTLLFCRPDLHTNPGCRVARAICAVGEDGVGAKAAQIAHPSHRGSRDIEHIGSRARLSPRPGS
jgi:hypothetical protein